MSTPVPPKPLTPAEKANWNKFVEFVSAQKMTNNPVLDQRNKQVGMSLLQKFNYANPSNSLDTNIIPRVQQDLQNYRSGLVNQWKAGKIQSDAKSENEIMPNISLVDGWPGTKTLSSKFPSAQVTVTTPTGTTVKDYGLNTDQFDKDRGLASNK